MTFDVLIKGGTVLDGIAKEGQLLDVGISGREIKAVGDLREARAGLTIEAAEKYVAPGFIDIQSHSDSYLTLLDISTQDSLVAQGITTIAVGHCGTSLAPLASPDALKSVQKWHSLAGANINWQTFEEYLTALDRHPLGVNVLSLVGHATLRRGLLGDEVRPATGEEVAMMSSLLKQSLKSGAAGMSLGLIYSHEVDASASELEATARLVADSRKLLSVHLRSESGHIVEALEEAIGLAKVAKARLKISHFKIQGRKNWDLLDQALGSLDRGYQQGVDVFFDVYPYTTSWTVLYTYLPRWSYEGGRAGILRHLAEPSSRQRILSYLRALDQDLASIFVATSETNPAFVGKNLAQIAANQEVSIEEALLNVLSATSSQVVVFDHNLSSEVLMTLLGHPLSVVASDGAGYDLNYPSVQGLVHPRCFGTMPRFLSLVRDQKLMGWAAAIKKITSRPAEKLGLRKRGRLAPGMFADLVVFDPRDIGSRASYENPYQAADGIAYVLVNGSVSFSSQGGAGKPAGQVLRV